MEPGGPSRKPLQMHMAISDLPTQKEKEKGQWEIKFVEAFPKGKINGRTKLLKINPNIETKTGKRRAEESF